MRNQIIILFLAFFTSNIFAQLENEHIYGTWETELTNNEVFRIELFETSKGPQGHFEKISIDSSGNETIIYTSNRKINDAYDFWFLPAIHFGTIGTNSLRKGFLDDNTVTNTVLQPGCFEFEYVSSNPLKAHWRVDFCPGLKAPDEYFNIPTDLILTKVN